MRFFFLMFFLVLIGVQSQNVKAQFSTLVDHKSNGIGADDLAQKSGLRQQIRFALNR